MLYTVLLEYVAGAKSAEICNLTIASGKDCVLSPVLARFHLGLKVLGGGGGGVLMHVAKCLATPTFVDHTHITC